MKELTITEDKAIKAFNEANSEGKKLLKNLLGFEVFEPAKNIMERVKTVEDAISILGEDNIFVREYNYILNELGDDATPDILAYQRLRIVTAALNEGWVPIFSSDEIRYYAWFWVYTKEEYDNLDEEDKKDCRVVGRSHNNASAYGGVAYASAGNASACSHASFGSRLAFKTRELAEYCGKQFLDLWMDFLV